MEERNRLVEEVNTLKSELNDTQMKFQNLRSLYYDLVLENQQTKSQNNTWIFITIVLFMLLMFTK